jgi:hypothetical protein
MPSQLYAVLRILLCLASASGLLGAAESDCPLENAKDGQTITFRAVVMPTAHDILLRPLGCQDRVLLEYPDEKLNGMPASSLRRDRNFSRFTRFTVAQEKGTATAMCKECWKYEVVADFRGRLDIAERAGFKFDEKSEKAIGIDGFGHPMPFTRFRLVLLSVSNVKATRAKAGQQSTELQRGVER